MTGKISTSIQASIQVFLLALVTELIANPSVILSRVPKADVDIVTVVLGAVAVALHVHGVNRDSQGNVIPPPPK